MKNFISVVAAVCLMALAVQAHAWEVAGANDPAIDVPAVQAAVDSGEDVQLSGTFSFHGRGGLGTVSELPRVITVRHGIRISGPATIREGSGAFYVDAGAGAIEFSALRFEDTTLAGIIVWSAAGVLVEDCEFDGVIPFQVIGRPFLMAHGVVVNPPMPAPTGGPPVLRHANVTGNVSVADSTFDLRVGLLRPHLIVGSCRIV